MITVLALICSFWGFNTLDHHRLNAPEAVKNLLHELDEQNQTEYLLLVADQWSHWVPHLWEANHRAITVPFYDLNKHILKKKRKFHCQMPTYWLGLSSKQPTVPGPLQRFGQWKIEPSKVLSDTHFVLYKVH